MMMEGDQNFDGKHAMQYTGDALQNCTPEINVIN